MSIMRCKYTKCLKRKQCLRSKMTNLSNWQSMLMYPEKDCVKDNYKFFIRKA